MTYRINTVFTALIRCLRVTLLVFLSAQALTVFAAERPRILITNDDGIDAEGIVVLARALAEIGDVTVVAPLINQSGTSHSSILLDSPLQVEQRDFGEGILAFGINGTPADCVAFGAAAFGEDVPFDLLVSGINYGSNGGITYFYSGTLGAAFEGAYRGLKAIAVSQDHRREEYQFSADLVVQLSQQLLVEGLGQGIVLSLNVPVGNVLGLKGVLPGGSPYVGGVEVERGSDGDYQFNPSISEAPVPEVGSELDLFARGWATLTPLNTDRGHPQSMVRIKDLSVKTLCEACGP